MCTSLKNYMYKGNDDFPLAMFYTYCIFASVLFNPLSTLPFQFIAQGNHLAHGDIKTDGAWVIVLEVVEIQGAGGTDLQANTLSALAWSA